MDWKNFVNHFNPMTCILSVEKKPDGGCGTIRIVTGNDGYLDSLALAAGGLDLDSNEKTEFVPNSEYTRYIPKDLNFEDVCYRCAVLKEPIHNSVRMSRYSFDMNVFLLPLECDDENVAYCSFTQVLLLKSDDNLLSMNISKETATDVISTCIKLQGDRPFHDIMQEVIEDIRSICAADFCCILLMDETRRSCSILGQAKAPDSPHEWMENYMDEDFYDLAETWQDTLSGSFCLVIRDEEDMEYVRERNPVWYQSLTSAGVEHLIIFPLISQGHLIGYIWVTNFDTEDTLRIKDTLELTTYFIASEIASHRFIDQLQALSRIDMLTGVMNRNAMNNRVSELSEAGEEELCHMGMVFADMNGLKYVNDNQGHMAGDMLLKNAAMILQSTFAGDEIYRVGGDEFLVMLHKTDMEDMQKKIGDVKRKSEMFENVSFSAGCCTLDGCRDIRRALSEADARMYKDKKDYYSRGKGIKR
ncbi:MAG: sensor domain-containing diguanylate cyclase [Eubacterium sp.]|nr:sensor domain-containing diguanylate cyclase [Eubacterium sp.]